jgi:hypothetical protein
MAAGQAPTYPDFVLQNRYMDPMSLGYDEDSPFIG